MKLANYYQMQKVLDTKIEAKFNFKPHETIFHKLLALIVEIGEASNEHRGFKFWSEDQKPRREKLLAEFVDSWHFAIGVGNSLNIAVEEVEPRLFTSVTKGTIQTIYRVCQLTEGYDMELSKHILERRYRVVLEYLLGLGMAYGFTEDEIEAAYIQKNQENHERQLNHY